MSNATNKMTHRLLDQYRNNLRFAGFLGAIGRRFDDTDSIIYHYLFNRYLESAAGQDLDWVGEKIGMRRPARYREERIFRYRSKDDPGGPSERGYNAGVYQSADGLPLVGEGNVTVGDDEYRELLRWRAASYDVGASVPEVWRWVRAVVDADVDVDVVSPAPGSVTIRLLGFVPRRTRWILKKYCPVVAGVSVSVV